MIERRYTVKEIDELREAVSNKWYLGLYDPYAVEPFPAPIYGRSMMGEEGAVKIIEERVRTFMLAGMTAEDCKASEKSK